MGVVLGVLVVAAISSPLRAEQSSDRLPQRATLARYAAQAEPLLVAQAQGTEQPELRPRYEPVPPSTEPKPSYNSDYLFGMTRAVANSTMHPGAKAPLFVLTVPLDIVFLPFEAIGGFFG
jgi:hypothetical protein